MKPSTAFTPASNLAILVVGDPGTGKSRLALSWPDPGILDCDGNLAAAVRHAGAKPFMYSQPFIDDSGKEVPVIDRWNRACAETKLLLTSPSVKTFVLDGLSNLCRWGLIHAENELVKAGINIRKEYLAKYQSFIPLLSNYITFLRIPGKFVVVNVHQIIEKDELTGRTLYKLDIPGRLADTLGGQFTDVLGLSSLPDPSNVKTGAKYLIRTRPSGYHINLKTSLDLVPSINITDKTCDQIWNIFSTQLSHNAKPNIPVPTATVTK